MMSDLLSFEFLKKWKIYRPVILGSLILQAAVLAVSKVNLGNRAASVMTLFMLLYGIMMGVMLCMPFFESIFSFSRDLSGRQAVLELSIPIISWKKIAAKLVAGISCILGFTVLAGAYLTSVLVLVNGQGKTVALAFEKIFDYIKAAPGECFLALLSLLFFLASLLMVIYFCLALAKSISHKNKIAVPIAIVVFIAYFCLLGLTAPIAEKFPIVIMTLYHTQYSLMSVLVNVFWFAAAFLATSWLMEKRIES